MTCREGRAAGTPLRTRPDSLEEAEAEVDEGSAPGELHEHDETGQEEAMQTPLRKVVSYPEHTLHHPSADRA